MTLYSVVEEYSGFTEPRKITFSHIEGTGKFASMSQIIELAVLNLSMPGEFQANVVWTYVSFENNFGIKYKCTF